MSRRLAIALIIIALVAGSGFVLLAVDFGDPRERPLFAWWRGNEATRRALSIVRREPCSGAPFILPADGYIGLLYGDPRGPYSQERPHQGIDIFSTNFIEPALPAGTREFFVEQGTLLGYTGNYSGSPLRTVWTHLHFSIVADDGQGHYRNELQYENTFDPTPYLNIEVTYAEGEAVAPSDCRGN